MVQFSVENKLSPFFYDNERNMHATQMPHISAESWGPQLSEYAKIITIAFTLRSLSQKNGDN